MKTKLLLAASLLFGMSAVKAQFSPFNRVINVKLDTVATYSYATTQGTTSYLDSKPGVSATFFPYPKVYTARVLFAASATTDGQFSLNNSGVLTMKNAKSGVIKTAVYGIQNADAIVKFSFTLDLTNFTSANQNSFIIAFGNSASGTLVNVSNTFTTAQSDIFGAFRVITNSGNTFINQYRNAAGDGQVNTTETLIKANTSHAVEIFVNTTNGSSSYTYASSPVNISANTYHIYVNGVKYAAEFPKVGTTYTASNINGLSFTLVGGATQETVSISNLSITYPSATDPTLPVSLTSFTGKKAANGITLNWATASEQHNDYFEVTRSTDGKTFASIGTVKGKGATNQSSRYSLTDDAPVSGTNYYQLKQYDVDGSQTTYQETVAVDYALNQEHFAVNAAQNKLNVSVYSSVEGWGELTVFDLKGEKLIQTKVQLKVGQNIFAVDAGKLTSGLLIARLTGANLNKVAKFIK